MINILMKGMLVMHQSNKCSMKRIVLFLIVGVLGDTIAQSTHRSLLDGSKAYIVHEDKSPTTKDNL